MRRGESDQIRRPLHERGLAAIIPLLVLFFAVGFAAHQWQDARLTVAALVTAFVPAASLAAVVALVRSPKRRPVWAWAIVAVCAIAVVTLAGPIGGIAAMALLFVGAAASAAAAVAAALLTVTAFVGARARRFVTTGGLIVSLLVAATGVAHIDQLRAPSAPESAALPKPVSPAPSRTAVPPPAPPAPPVARPSEPPAAGPPSPRPDLAVPAPLADMPPGRYALFREGTFHAGEVRALPGPAFVLVRRGRQWELISVNVRFESVLDVVVDWPQTDQQSGVRVSIENRRALPAEELFLLTGPFAPGSLLSVTEEVQACVERWTSPTRESGPRRSCNVELAGNRYEISAAQVRHVQVEPGFTKPVLRLVVRQGPTAQKLPSFGPVLWAGDLDRDGGLDLLLDRAFQYAEIWNVHLYLSSLAGPGAIFDRAADFHSSAD